MIRFQKRWIQNYKIIKVNKAKNMHYLDAKKNLKKLVLDNFNNLKTQ